MKRNKICPVTLSEAMKDIRNGCSYRKAAEKYHLPKSTICKYFQMNKDYGLNDKTVELLKNDVKQIFEEYEEVQLCEYLKKAAYLHMGLDSKQVRDLAYQFAIAKKKERIPASWHKHKTAGIGWLRCFRQRYTELSLRKPESTSLARATSFNRANVSNFFDNLEKVMKKHNFPPDSVYNVDETGVSTVHQPRKVLAPKKIRQLGKLTSGERGTNNTMIACINAVGNTIPPLIIFPRVYFKDHMLKGAPPGSIGAANQSGWSTEAIFLQYLDHFIKHAKPTKERPVLLTMDNHESHISIEMIDKATDNGIVLLTLPPHTSNKLQALDRCVFGPFKSQYNKAADRWMLNHPGKPISIYDVAEIIGEAYSLSFTPKNIIKSFEATGIYPVNRDIFNDEDFVCSYVTDRPQPTAADNLVHQTDLEPLIENLDTPQEKALSDIPTNQKQPHVEVPAASRENNQIEAECAGRCEPNENLKNAAILPTPETIRPFHKAETRKLNQRGRKQGKTRILTDTPEKTSIRNEALIKKEKKRKNAAKIVKKSAPKKKPELIDLISKPGPSTRKISPNKTISVLEEQHLSIVMCVYLSIYC